MKRQLRLHVRAPTTWRRIQLRDQHNDLRCHRIVGALFTWSQSMNRHSMGKNSHYSDEWTCIWIFGRCLSKKQSLGFGLRAENRQSCWSRISRWDTETELISLMNEVILMLSAHSQHQDASWETQMMDENNISNVFVAQQNIGEPTYLCVCWLTEEQNLPVWWLFFWVLLPLAALVLGAWNRFFENKPPPKETLFKLKFSCWLKLPAEWKEFVRPLSACNLLTSSDNPESQIVILNQQPAWQISTSHLFRWHLPFCETQKLLLLLQDFNKVPAVKAHWGLHKT